MNKKPLAFFPRKRDLRFATTPLLLL